jgi:uncharacterized Zn finger protein
MLIVFGIGSSVDLVTAVTYVCEHCGNHARHDILRERRRLSLFFIPVLPVGGARYLDECTVCGRVLSISESDAENAVRTAKGPQDSPTWSPQDR